MKHLFHAVAAAAALSMAATPAFATATASASLGPLTIRLIDLDPMDGVTPTVSFSGESCCYNFASAVLTLSGSPQQHIEFGQSLWANSSASMSGGGSQAQASISGVGGLSVSGSGGLFDAEAYAYGVFSLSANTLLAISASADISGATSDTIEGRLVSSSTLLLRGPGSQGTGSQDSDDVLEQFFEVYPAPLPIVGVPNWTMTGTLSASFVNLTSQRQEGVIELSSRVYSTQVAAPIPEPETYALMLAGLAAIGLMARRRA